MAEILDAKAQWNKKLTDDFAKVGFKLEADPTKADVTIVIEDNKKVVLTTADGKRYEHDFGCNGYYAEMFRLLREVVGVDSRVKWFNEIKDEFFATICFGGHQSSRW